MPPPSNQEASQLIIQTISQEAVWLDKSLQAFLSTQNGQNPSNILSPLPSCYLYLFVHLSRKTTDISPEVLNHGHLVANNTCAASISSWNSTIADVWKHFLCLFDIPLSTPVLKAIHIFRKNIFLSVTCQFFYGHIKTSVVCLSHLFLLLHWLLSQFANNQLGSPSWFSLWKCTVAARLGTHQPISFMLIISVGGSACKYELLL